MPPFALTTADPAFAPNMPVMINGFRFSPSKRKTFFIVFSPDGEAPAKVVHQTHGKALWAAHELAKKHPGQTFHVMEVASKPIAVEIAAETERAITEALNA